MDINKKELNFVLSYFLSGKLDTQKALREVKARAGESLGNEENLSSAKILRMNHRRWMAVAASVAVLLIVGAYALLQPKVIELKAAEQVAVYRLPDGTQVTLSPFSSVSYREDDCRKVEMKGCAYYQVRHDELHPFDVEGERGHVRVLGTQFMVDERNDVTEVMVTSGKVLFSARNSAEGIFLTKGKRAHLLRDASRPELLAGYDVNDVAWATHRLHFDNAPLAEVLEELSKLSGKGYSASDENKRLTGDFDVDSIPQVIQVIEETLGVSIQQMQKTR